MTCKVQRTTHRVGFGVGSLVQDLIELLKKIPIDATVNEVLCDHEDEPDVTTIEFHEESRVE